VLGTRRAILGAVERDVRRTVKTLIKNLPLVVGASAIICSFYLFNLFGRTIPSAGSLASVAFGGYISVSFFATLGIIKIRENHLAVILAWTLRALNTIFVCIFIIFIVGFVTMVSSRSNFAIDVNWILVAPIIAFWWLGYRKLRQVCRKDLPNPALQPSPASVTPGAGHPSRHPGRG